METAKVFMNGRSEAVRLPKNCRFGSAEIYVKKVGSIVLLVPKEKTWEVFMQSLDGFSADFMNARPSQPPQKRRRL
jgi:antitoxin VapB